MDLKAEDSGLVLDLDLKVNLTSIHTFYVANFL